MTLISRRHTRYDLVQVQIDSGSQSRRQILRLIMNIIKFHCINLTGKWLVGLGRCPLETILIQYVLSQFSKSGARMDDVESNLKHIFNM